MIKITGHSKNIEKIMEDISKCQKGCIVRLFLEKDLQNLVNFAGNTLKELQVPLENTHGCIFWRISGLVRCNSYPGLAASTVVRIIKRSSHFYYINSYRQSFNTNKRLIISFKSFSIN